MIECPSCGHQHRPGTLFCSECGVYLLTGGPLRTEPLPESDLPSSRADPWESGEALAQAEAQAESTIVIVPPSGLIDFRSAKRNCRRSGKTMEGART